VPIPYFRRYAKGTAQLKKTNNAWSEFVLEIYKLNPIYNSCYQIQAYLPALDSKHLTQMPYYFNGIVVGQDSNILNNNSQHESKPFS